LQAEGKSATSYPNGHSNSNYANGTGKDGYLGNSTGSAHSLSTATTKTTLAHNNSSSWHPKLNGYESQSIKQVGLFSEHLTHYRDPAAAVRKSQVKSSQVNFIPLPYSGSIG
jgi:hypothetical protein